VRNGRSMWAAAGMLLATQLVLASPTTAQFGPASVGRPAFSPRLAIGVRVGRDFDADVWSLGGQLRFSLPFLPGIELMPSGDVFVPDDGAEWQLNLDAVLRPGRVSLIYVGGGVAVMRDEFFVPNVRRTEVGYNLLIGLRIPVRRVPLSPFVEARWTFIEAFDPFRLVTGVNLRLGGRPGRR